MRKLLLAGIMSLLLAVATPSFGFWSAFSGSTGTTGGTTEPQATYSPFGGYNYGGWNAQGNYNFGGSTIGYGAVGGSGTGGNFTQTYNNNVTTNTGGTIYNSGGISVQTSPNGTGQVVKSWGSSRVTSGAGQ